MLPPGFRLLGNRRAPKGDCSLCTRESQVSPGRQFCHWCRDDRGQALPRDLLNTTYKAENMALELRNPLELLGSQTDPGE